jgi:hypothetical protein
VIYSIVTNTGDSYCHHSSNLFQNNTFSLLSHRCFDLSICKKIISRKFLRVLRSAAPSLASYFDFSFCSFTSK